MVVVFSDSEIGWVVFVTSFLVERWNFDYGERFLKRSRKLILMLRTAVVLVTTTPIMYQGETSSNLSTRLERYRSRGSSISSKGLGIHKVSSQVSLRVW